MNPEEIERNNREQERRLAQERSRLQAWEAMRRQPQAYDTFDRSLQRMPVTLTDRRLLSVAGDRLGKVGYYDVRGCMVQCQDVTSTTAPNRISSGMPLPSNIDGLLDRVNALNSTCRWDNRRDRPLNR